jgi:hypothetical protein
MKKVFFNNFLLLSVITPSFLLAVPNKPSDLELKALSSTSISIKWKDNSDDEIGYKIFRDGKLIKVLAANTTTYIDNNLSPNTTYKYTIKSTDNTIDLPILTDVHISEVLASNKNVLTDPDYFEYSDYIEIKNYKDHSVDIGGYTISDNKHSWTIPNNTTIAANSHLLIWADERDSNNNALHTNFKLSSKKESVTLKDRNGNIVEKISYKKLPPNTSVRVVNDKLAYTLPSPLKDSKIVYSKMVTSNKPIFSKNGGFYQEAQTISLSTNNKAQIYYTLDGTTPTKNSTKYTSAINISKTTVIKAISIESGKVASEVNTQSYIIDVDTTLPIISLSTDSKNLFDDYIGIYTDGKNGKVKHCSDGDDNPKNFNQDWERPVYMEYFNENGESIVSIGLDFAISGQCSRFNTKKHFSFETSKSKYGQKNIEYKLYPTKDIDKFKDFKLRAGEAGFQQRDIIASKLVELGNLNIDYQAYRAVRMFMNGEYWGVYNVREKKGKDYLKSNYPDIDEDNLDIIGNGIKSGDKVEYNKLHNFIKNHDLSNDSNYQEILTIIDEDNFIDYMILMTYSGNRDWYDNNFRCWRERKDGAKWRWMLDDLDYGFIIPDRSNFDLATHSGTMMTDLFRKLLKNSTFKNKFKSRYYNYLDNLFTSENMQQIIDDIVDERRAYMDQEDKWGITLRQFDSDVNRLRDFARNRKRYVKDQIDEL